MSFIYTFGSTFLSLLIILSLCTLSIFFIEEMDKKTYIDNYKGKIKWYKLPTYYLLEVLTYLSLVLSLLIFIIFGMSNKLMKKKIKIVFSSILVTLFLGITPGYIIVDIISDTLVARQFYVVSILLDGIYEMSLYVIVPYFSILVIKKIINMVEVKKFS